MQKRILLLATVAALMSVMLVVSAASAAFAHSDSCPGPKWTMVHSGSPIYSPSDDRDNDGLHCTNLTRNGFIFKDDHVHG